MQDNKILAWLMLGLGLFSLGLGMISGKPEYYSDVLFFYAFLLYTKIRDQQFEQATSCANCERRAEFCKCCCDRIADGQSVLDKRDAARYRFLRAAPTAAPYGVPRIAVPADSVSGEFVSGKDADEAVDAARRHDGEGAAA